MISTLITAPTNKPITTAEAKTHLRVTSSDDDTYIGTLIDVALEYVESVTRRKLITQTWEVFYDDWPDGDYLELPYGQLQSVSYVKYTESDDTVTTWPTDYYSVDTDSDPGRIVLGHGETWPTATLTTKNPIVVRFVCGYGDNASDVPALIRHAMKFIISDMYEVRETRIIGQSVSKYGDAITNCLNPYRLWGF